MLAYVLGLISAAVADRKGVTAMEYGIIAAVTVVVVGAAMGGLSGNLATLWGDISSALGNAV